MSGDEENRAVGHKTYVRPVVSKHKAASLVTGSGCGGCGQYVSTSGGLYNYGCDGIYTSSIGGFCYYH
jgi:hypothetical protein